jgi:glycosyltransferase involved in cell wall biosynthesis
MTVADVMAQHPNAIDLLAAQHSAFERLRNPLLRKAFSRLVTLRQAAAIAGVDLAALMDALNGDAGLAEGLVARGHSVTVLTSQHERGLARRSVLRGVRVVRAPVVGRLSRTVIMPTYPFALIREVAKADVVHLHTPMPEAALVAGVARVMRTPIVVTHHGDVVMPSVGRVNAIVQLVMELITRWAMRLSDRVIVHTEDYRDHSTFLAPLVDRIDAIYPPVEVPAPRPAEAAAWRRELELEDHDIVGFAGRFVEEKGFDFLLQAIPFVRERRPGARFVFAGESQIVYERFFERSLPYLEPVRDLVIELGLLSDPQTMADYYSMCDVFVLPSRTDCFAIVQVESLLCAAEPWWRRSSPCTGLQLIACFTDEREPPPWPRVVATVSRSCLLYRQPHEL